LWLAKEAYGIPQDNGVLEPLCICHGDQEDNNQQVR